MEWVQVVIGILEIVAIIILGLFLKNYFPSYMDEKGKNLATKEDIAEITRKTEVVQQEFRENFERFSSDIRFKYDFYYRQYTELYCKLYAIVIQSEYVRRFMKLQTGKETSFDEAPFLEISPTRRRTNTLKFENGAASKVSTETEEIITPISQFNKKQLCDYIIEVGKKWVSPPYNVDGWRLDVAADLGHSQEFNHEFWKKFRKAVKEANPEAIILAEHYGDANSWLQGDQWDTIMNYDGFMDPVTWFLTGVDKHSDNSNPGMRGDAGTFKLTMQYQMSRMQNQSLLVAMNELSNHDHSRFLTRTNRMVGRVGTAGTAAASQDIDEAIFKQGVVMQMTLPGAPTLYYGDEAGVCGWTDPDNRRTYPWGYENFEILEFYRETIAIHRQHKVFKTGSYKPLVEQRDLLCYGRFDMDNAAFVAINTSDTDKTVSIPTWTLGVEDGESFERLIETSREFYNCGRVKVVQENDVVTVTVKANSSVIYHK